MKSDLDETWWKFTAAISPPSCTPQIPEKQPDTFKKLCSFKVSRHWNPAICPESCVESEFEV